jgi:hypothetical protein
MQTRVKLNAMLCYALPLMAMALLATGCGTSSSSPSEAASGGQSASLSVTAAKAHRDTVTAGMITHLPKRGTGAGEINDDNPANADSPSHGHSTVRGSSGVSDPCALVSRAQARGILGKLVSAPIEAPLGPTCLYRAGSGVLVTVALDPIDIRTIKAHLHNRSQVKIGRHTAYCGTYGQTTTFVPFASGQTLTVSAPCMVGFRFAEAALSRLDRPAPPSRSKARRSR